MQFDDSPEGQEITRLQALLRDGLERGSGAPVTKAFWAELKGRMDQARGSAAFTAAEALGALQSVADEGLVSEEQLEELLRPRPPHPTK